MHYSLEWVPIDLEKQIKKQHISVVKCTYIAI